MSVADRRRFNSGPIKHGAGGRDRLLEYGVWATMIQRCTNPNVRGYRDYGARGVRVCDRWRHDFAAFLADMGMRPSPQHSIDRIDPTGNYEPGNCRWATRIEQARNHRNNRIIRAGDFEATLAEWSEVTGIRYERIRRRLAGGWHVVDALTVPPQASGFHWRRRVGSTC